jgi:hypothetical protein
MGQANCAGCDKNLNLDELQFEFETNSNIT